MKVKKYQLESLIEKLQNCVDEMNDQGVDEIPTKCSTYKMYNFISFGSSGYLNLDYDYIEVGCEDNE